MNFVKTIALLGAIFLCTTAQSKELRLTQDDVCKKFLSDAVDIGVIYTNNDNGREEAAKWVADRIKMSPMHEAFLPGDLRIIDSMDKVKLTKEGIVDFSVAVYSVCMQEGPDGWVQDIVGGKINRPVEESPKVKI